MKPILSASLINCHAEEMDSIVFRAPAPMVRMFIALPGHTLWRNLPDYNELFSVAIHMHRQDISMVPLFGEIHNMFFETKNPVFKGTLAAFEYSSQIADGKGGFKRVGEATGVALKMEQLEFPLFLSGDQFHTVYVPKGKTAAWLICEGPITHEYSPVCYTNNWELDQTDFSNLYRTMTEERLAEDMELLDRNLQANGKDNER